VPTIIDGAARRLTVSKSPLHLKFIDKAALIHSVFSEAFLVGVDAIVPTVIDLTALRWALFEILDVPTHHVTSCFKWSIFASSTAGRTKLRIFW